VVSFINVVGCGTEVSSGIRQNRRHVIESLRKLVDSRSTTSW
jgi:hypothetical protein